MRTGMRAGLTLLILLMAVPAGLCGEVGAAAAATRLTRAEADGWVRGYLEAWIVHSLGLDREQVRIAVEEGVVEMSGYVDAPEQGDRLVALAESLEGVEQVVEHLSVGPPEPQAEEEGARWRSWFAWARRAPGKRTLPFPKGELFTAPMADPRQPRFHTTLQRWDTEFGSYEVGSVGFGESFGLVRWPGTREGDGWQLGISGAVFAIFNMDTASKDLLNADYVVGFPLSARRGSLSGRFRLYHQSSHLGDEFLLNPQPGPPVERINLSFEALEALGSYEWKSLRGYLGATRILHSHTPLERWRAQAGADFRGRTLHWKTARIVAGLDLQWWEETDWDLDVSVKAGMMFRSPYSQARSIQVLLEYYDGHTPHGQFYELEVDYWGVGVAFAF